MSAKAPESVWDYPRPPRIEATGEVVVVELGETVIAETTRPLRVLETASPPTYYLPFDDVLVGALEPIDHRTHCEWKGLARYFSVRGGFRVEVAAAWHYPEPTPAFEALRGHVAFYPGRMDRCTVDGEVVEPQPGDFYGGWVTSRIRGPFKGEPGTEGW